MLAGRRCSPCGEDPQVFMGMGGAATKSMDLNDLNNTIGGGGMVGSTV